MRDFLCNEEELKKAIKDDENEIVEKWDKVNRLLKDIQDGIQRKPKKNEDILFSVKNNLYILVNQVVRAKYSLGLPCKELENTYLEGLGVVFELGCSSIGYVNYLQYFALGILLETDKAEMERLVKKADEDKLDDLIFDFLVSSYGLKRSMASSKYQKEKPYKLLTEIIELSFHDKDASAKKLKEYMQVKWLRGHADYGWVNAHKEAGYVGLWSFEAAAVAKILCLDDCKLENDNHYPYDLAHYKNNKELVITPIKESKERFEPDMYEFGIAESKELEQIIPVQFHKLINQLLLDYRELEDQRFWKKYNLDDIWFTIEEYRMDKRNEELLGQIIVNVLVNSWYILQLDYKVPQDSNLKRIYEIELIDIN